MSKDNWKLRDVLQSLDKEFTQHEDRWERGVRDPRFLNLEN